MYDVSWLLAVNQVARATPWLHPLLAGYAEFGVVVFAALVAVGWWRARQRGRGMTGLALGALVTVVGYRLVAPMLRRLLAAVRRTRLRPVVEHRPPVTAGSSP